MPGFAFWSAPIQPRGEGLCPSARTHAPEHTQPGSLRREGHSLPSLPPLLQGSAQGTSPFW